MSRKISNFQKPTTFTAKVVMEGVFAKTRVKETNFTFTVGYEYIGSNITKGSSRPPKMRILGLFTPLVNGQPNATNDTYVIFQNYDYNLNRFRGPYCGAATKNQITQGTPLDFYIATIDKFGKNYGDSFSGIDGGVSGNFTPPTINYTVATNITYGNSGGLPINTKAGHLNGVFKLPNGDTIDFHGFLTVSGYSGTWGLYSLKSNGSLKTFDATATRGTLFKSGVYPYVTPLTGKSTNEWRYMPICAQTLAGLNYFPLSNAGQNFGLRYSESSNPIEVTYNGLLPVDLYTSNLPSSDQELFNQTGRFLYSDEQGVSLAPSGYYATTTNYSYYDSTTGNFSGAIAMSGGGGGGFNGTEYLFLGPYFDPNTACAEDGRAEFFQGFINGDQYPQPDFGAGVFDSSTGTSPVGWAAPGMWFKVFDSGYGSLEYTVTFDESTVISDKLGCR